MNFNPGPAGFFRRLSPLQQVRHDIHLVIYKKPFQGFLFNKNGNRANFQIVVRWLAILVVYRRTCFTKNNVEPLFIIRMFMRVIPSGWRKFCCFSVSLKTTP
jgi:hypothetical protein